MTEHVHTAVEFARPLPRPAQTVVHRHPCECEAASRPLAEGEHAEHVFDVDGLPFPWHISHAGPTFQRVLDDLWVVTVTLLPGARRAPDNQLVFCAPGFSIGGRWVPRESNPEGSYGLLVSTIPEVDGEPFPWSVTGDGYTVRHTRKTMLEVSLGFLAASVDTDGPWVDARGAAVYDLDGSWYGGETEHHPSVAVVHTGASLPPADEPDTSQRGHERTP
jgi:hypothetical protein